MELEFPAGFFWGAATSAHQVEGGTRNDWGEWEQKKAKSLSQMANGRAWPDFILKNYPNPLQEENYVSGRACDHYNRFREDFDIVKSLDHNAHRFSIEWSRIEPEEGKLDEKEIEHYWEIVKALRQRGLEPFVTLWHWTLPSWVRDIGGWENKKTVDHFSRYAAKMAEALGSDVKFWITLNEANVYSGNGYFKGIWPPGKRSLVKYLRVNHHLSQAHIAAYDFIKEKYPVAQVGVAQNFVHFAGFGAPVRRYFYNFWFLNSIRRCQDFIGVNYYISDRRAVERTDMDWPIDPDGFYSVLNGAGRYKKPVYVLENGLADARDSKRADFIKEHIKAMKKAMDGGVDVRGYFYWSLLDNFEWDKGFWPRFGLVEIDYRTLERKIRPSAWEYAKICKSNSLEADM